MRKSWDGGGICCFHGGYMYYMLVSSGLCTCITCCFHGDYVVIKCVHACIHSIACVLAVSMVIISNAVCAGYQLLGLCSRHKMKFSPNSEGTSILHVVQMTLEMYL